MIGQSILIVEDELGVARPLQRALSLVQEGNYRIETCITGEAALERLQAQAFDLLITDLRLPGLDGLSLLEQARQLHPALRSVLITAFGSPEVEAKAHHLANAYLPKPFHLRDLVRLVQRILSEPTSERSTWPPGPVSAGLPKMAERRRATHFKVLACDLDGTLAKDNVVAPQTWDALRRAKASGLTLLLVTGRTLDTFINTGPFAELFEALVTEDGAVIYFPRRDVTRTPFGRLSSALVQRLEEMKIPLERGVSIVATRVPYDELVLKALQEVNAGATIEYNRGAVMLLPPGATKGTGLTYALRELGFSPRNVVVCGDAENDRSMFEVAELSVAVPNALPKIKAMADTVLPTPENSNGTGFEALVNELLTRRGPTHRQRPERRLTLGYSKDEAPVYLDPLMLVDSRLGIFGASGTGKSWLAGLITEELFKLGYQVCIIDPEGDYRVLASSTQSLLLGGPNMPQPSVPDVINFSEWHGVSLILDLSAYAHEDRRTFVQNMLRALRGLRVRRGRPHWLLIDEIQFFCPDSDCETTRLLLEAMCEGMGCGIVSYRPSQVAQSLLEKLDHWLITRLNLPEEISLLQNFLARYEDGSAMLTQLPELPVGHTYLCSNSFRPLTSRLESPVRFRTGPRAIPHIRHLHKYLRAPLPDYKRFYFHDQNQQYLGFSAASLWEFREILHDLPMASLQYHLQRGDFERWLGDVLHDEDLAHRIHKVRGRDLQGGELRQAILEAVINRYEELENLA